VEPRQWARRLRRAIGWGKRPALGEAADRDHPRTRRAPSRHLWSAPR